MYVYCNSQGAIAVSPSPAHPGWVPTSFSSSHIVCTFGAEEKTTWCHLSSVTAADETIGVGWTLVQNRPLSLPSLPTYSEGTKLPCVDVACRGLSEAEYSTPFGVDVLNQSEYVNEGPVPVCTDGRVRSELLPLNPAAVPLPP